jgi:hypothetical protein
MRPQEGADVAHRQGDLVLGGLPWVEADLRYWETYNRPNVTLVDISERLKQMDDRRRR